MAKRKSEIVVRSIVGNLYEAWMDDDIADKVRAMPPIQEVYGRGTYGAPWGIKLDPRYDADEVIAEIEALGMEEIPIKSVSIKEEARVLGRAAGSVRDGKIILAVTELLEGAEEVCYDVDTYESTLSTIIGVIVERLRQGSW